MANSDRADNQCLNVWRNRALIIGLLGAALSAAGFWMDPKSFAIAYLTSFLFWLGLVIGCFPLVMIHHLTGGAWGYPVRRIFETLLGLIPFLALAFIPVLLNLQELYSWARPEVVAHDKILQDKVLYLNESSFTARAVFYFATWILFAFLLTALSKRFQKDQDRATFGHLQGLSGAGLIVYGLTVTFASVDWGMSLEPHWFSTIYGLLFMVGQTVAAFAFAIFMAVHLQKRKLLSDVMTPDRSHDLGNLLFAFIMLWAYISLSQFVIVWSGNLAEETPWYIRRFGGGWQVLSLLLTFLHFILPFFLLLGRDIKRNPPSLAVIAGIILAMRWVDIYWIIKPALYENITFHWLDLTTFAAIGGLSLAILFQKMTRESLTLSYDPLIQNKDGKDS